MSKSSSTLRPWSVTSNTRCPGLKSSGSANTSFTVYGRSADPAGANRTRTVSTPLTPDDATHGSSPATADECRRKYSNFVPVNLMSGAGSGPGVDGYSSHSVPSSDLRSPGAPMLMPNCFTTPLTDDLVKNVHISASVIGTSATDV